MPPKGWSKVSPEEWALAKERYAAGECVRAIAAALGVSEPCLRKHLRAEGLLRSRSEAQETRFARERGPITEAAAAALREQYESGAGLRRAGHALGAGDHRNRARRVLRQSGTPLRGKSEGASARWAKERDKQGQVRQE